MVQRRIAQYRVRVPGTPVKQKLAVGPLRIDVAKRIARFEDRTLHLTRKEFDLLAYLAARPDRVVSRQELIEEVWQQPYFGSEQTVDVHVSWLRRKLGETAAEPKLLRIVRGVGIMLVTPRV
jgi:DNA-binding response OmpR family regulator